MLKLENKPCSDSLCVCHFIARWTDAAVRTQLILFEHAIKLIRMYWLPTSKYEEKRPVWNLAEQLVNEYTIQDPAAKLYYHNKQDRTLDIDKFKLVPDDAPSDVREQLEAAVMLVKLMVSML